MSETRGMILDPSCPIAWEHPLNRKLIARWMVPPNSGWRGGLTLRDLSRGGRTTSDGVLTNGPTWIRSDRRGGYGALQFVKASSRYVSIPSATIATSLSAGYTWSVWAQGTAAGGQTSDYQQVFLGGVASNSLAFSWNHLSASFTKAAYHRDGADVFIPVQLTSSLAAATWYHITTTWDGATLRIYLNGSLEGTAAATSLSSVIVGATELGGHDLGGTNTYFDGMADDFCMWSRALSGPQVNAFYQDTCRGSPETLRWLRPRSSVLPGAAATIRPWWQYAQPMMGSLGTGGLSGV